MAEEKRSEVTIRNLSDEDFKTVSESGLCAASLKLVNSALSTVDIHSKDYVTVPERVKAFRTMCPDGAITTDIVKLEGDEGRQKNIANATQKALQLLRNLLQNKENEQ